MCQDIDTGGVSPQNLSEQSRHKIQRTQLRVPCNPRPELDVFMNAATISTTDHRQLEVAGLAGAGQWWRWKS